MFAKLKLYAAIAGGLFFAMGAALLYSFNSGAAKERDRGIKEAARAQEKHNDRISDATQAGNVTRLDAGDPDRLRVDDGYKRKRKTK